MLKHFETFDTIFLRFFIQMQAHSLTVVPLQLCSPKWTKACAEAYTRQSYMLRYLMVDTKNSRSIKKGSLFLDTFNFFKKRPYLHFRTTHFIGIFATFMICWWPLFSKYFDFDWCCFGVLLMCVLDQWPNHVYNIHVESAFLSTENCSNQCHSKKRPEWMLRCQF